MYSEPEALLAKPHAQQQVRHRRIAYIPYEEMGNAYTDRMRELMAGFGSVERFAGIKSLCRQLPRSLRCYDAIVVNWLDNAIVDADSGRLSPPGIVRLFFKTLLMKAFARRMVFVRHNNYPHRTAVGSERLARRLADFYEALFDVVITHSGAAAGAQKRYCPHPLYRHAPVVPTSPVLASLPRDYFIAFGRIVPYKKLDALIESFPPRQTLVVAGSVGDAEYAASLSRLRRDNVILLPGHLAEAVAQQMVRSARGVVIANADEDVVVSGTFFYAMSLGCPVYAVATPFLQWVQQRIGDELLVLSPDLKRLCRAIATADPKYVSAASRAAVLREFGDRTVSAALAAALEIRP